VKTLWATAWTRSSRHAAIRDHTRVSYMFWQERIVVDPAILVGKPVVRGTRLSVELMGARLLADENVPGPAVTALRRE
jgi:hypothetical protein